MDLAQFAKGTDDLSSDFVGDVELGEAHLRRAEESILRSHGGQQTQGGQTLSTKFDAADEEDRQVSAFGYLRVGKSGLDAVQARYSRLRQLLGASCPLHT